MRNQRSNSDMSIMSDMAPPPSQNGQSAPPLIVESSQHFSINRLDLHICEESAQASAVQMTLTEMSVDYYPARKAARSRKEFNPYTEAMMARDKWIENILQVNHKFLNGFLNSLWKNHVGLTQLNFSGIS